MSALEHGALTIWLMVSLVVLIVITVEPYWALNTEANGLYIVNRLWTSVGLWQQCVSFDNGDNQCNTYDVPQNSLPAYFNFLRYSICITTGLTIIAIITSIASNPSLLPYYISDSTKFTCRLVTSSIMVVTGLLSLSAESWFTWTCIANELGPIVGPNNIITDKSNVGYALDLCTIIAFIISIIYVVAGFVHVVRACTLQSEHGLSNEEIYYRNKVLHEVNNRKGTKLYKPYSVVSNKLKANKETVIKSICPNALVNPIVDTTINVKETPEDRVRNWAYENRVYI